MSEHGHGDIIIIKKKVISGGGHHGGAWKIAFADFMTAMMAFFLVLWIINASDKETKTVIARYFNPVKLENPSKSKKGVHGATSAPTDGKEDKSDKTNAPPAEVQKDAKGSPSPVESKAELKNQGSKVETEKADAKARAAETQLFAAPYEALDKIAGAAGDVSPGASPEKGDADPQRMAGALSIDSFRDPFKPVGPGSPDDPVAFDSDARQKPPTDVEPGKTGPDEKPHEKPTPNATPVGKKPNEETKPTASPTNGATDAGAQSEVAKGDSPKAAADIGKLDKELKEKVAAAMNSGPGPDVEARQTKDGLLISLTDKLDFSMFTVGSAEPRAEIVHAMESIAKIVKQRQGHIIVRGYTDARPYKNGAYDNWRLSSDRAQMAYYMLTRGGVPASRFTRVEGYADRALHDPGHPLAAVNRRLEILIEEPRP